MTMLANDILTSSRLRGKLFAALLAFFSLRISLIAIGLGSILIAILAIFAIIIDALIELCGHIAQIWTASTPIERFLILVILWIFFVKLSPTIARFCRKGC